MKPPLFKGGSSPGSGAGAGAALATQLVNAPHQEAEPKGPATLVEDISRTMSKPILISSPPEFLSITCHYGHGRRKPVELFFEAPRFYCAPI